MREGAEDRQRRILATVQARGEARITDLAVDLEVSVITARRDVEELARAGRLRRGHGVARSLGAVDAPMMSGQPTRPPVAIVVPERHPYLDEAMRGARGALEAAGVPVAVHFGPKTANTEHSVVGRVLADGNQGLLIAPRWRTLADEQTDSFWLAQLDTPTVLMERQPRRGSILYTMDSVFSDHWYGIFVAVRHLVSLGHQRVAFAARNDSPTARAIRAAFAAIAPRQLDEWPVFLSAPDADAELPSRSDEVGAPMLAKLIRDKVVTAAIVHSDVDALMIVEQLAQSGFRVPVDCSLIAYDDIVADLGQTPLTAVGPPEAEVGRVAAGLLLERLTCTSESERQHPQHIAVLPELTVRNSTAAI